MKSVATAVALGVALCAGSARADGAITAGNGDGFDLRLFRPAVDSRGQFAVNGTDILGAGAFAFGLVVDYGRDLARVGAGPNGVHNRALVENMFTGTFMASVGIADWLVIGLQLPVHLASGPGGNGLDVAGYSPPAGGLSYQGVGDIALNLKLRLLRAERTNFGVAVVLQAAYGPGDGARNFAGDPGVVLWPSLALEWRPHRVFRMDLNAGYRFFSGRGAALPQGRGAVTYAPPVTLGLGMSVRVASAVDLVAEAYMASYTNALGDPAATPVEAVGGLKVFVERNSYLLLGAGSRVPVGDAPAAANLRAFVGFMYEPSVGDADGDGLRDDVDRCPSRPEDFDNFEDADGCPELDNDRDGILDDRDQCPNVPEDRDGDHDDDGCPESNDEDRDGDGIIDRADRCPDDPEDRDGFEDTDGCPDPDNDRDGILDVDDLCVNDAEDRDGFEDRDGCPDPDNDHDRIPDVRDRCPDRPETYNGERDDDGCPDEGVLVFDETGVYLLRPINFETNSARIRTDSLPIVEAVARVLRAHPEMDLVEVQGHADERGDDDHNLRLTIDRAAAVVQALTERGVARARLHSAGYGERCRAGYPATPGQEPVNAVCQGGRGPRWCHSERAWQNDRRVVFLILRATGRPAGVRVVCDAGEDLIPPDDRQYHRP